MKNYQILQHSKPFSICPKRTCILCQNTMAYSFLLHINRLLLHVNNHFHSVAHHHQYIIHSVLPSHMTIHPLLLPSFHLVPPSLHSCLLLNMHPIPSSKVAKCCNSQYRSYALNFRGPLHLLKKCKTHFPQ